MIQLYEQRPPLTSEQDTYHQWWCKAESARLRLAQYLQKRGRAVPEHLLRESPKVQCRVPSLLLTDEYLLAHMRFEHARNVSVTLALALAIAVGVKDVATAKEFPLESLGYLAGAIIAAIASSVPFARSADRLAELQNQEKRKN